ncbi:MAG TPA: PEP/pyruvate-binding domain-containing protein, partial [Candidatus Hodarchaeales archaeon]|nr:PEP/pyruvate-binding domain-containing protein [Candidatus Hodarchaeales archaeon]
MSGKKAMGSSPTKSLDKHVVLFSEATPDKKVVGGKGAGLIEMTMAGLPVPPGFIIDIEMCKEFNRGGSLPPGLMAVVKHKMGQLEKLTGKVFGGPPSPLLVSVR